MTATPGHTLPDSMEMTSREQLIRLLRRDHRSPDVTRFAHQFMVQFHEMVHRRTESAAHHRTHDHAPR